LNNYEFKFAILRIDFIRTRNAALRLTAAGEERLSERSF
jgi:hypothetical protein